VHDASTIAFLFYPELVSFVRASVKISADTEGGTRGFTFFDQRHHP
jgi:inosine-uridine nucleoside N-ribohydrolase